MKIETFGSLIVTVEFPKGHNKNSIRSPAQGKRPNKKIENAPISLRNLPFITLSKPQSRPLR